MTMETHDEQNLNDSLRRLRNNIPRLTEGFGLYRDENVNQWIHIVDSKLLPRLSPDFPITATICGGGSSGKSTLFNSMVQANLSPVAGSAGLNRRVLVSAHEELFERPDVLSTLFEPFGSLPHPLKDKHDLKTQGHPLYVSSNAIPQNLVLMDTPDFDTGARGVYTNRDVARQALESSDILIYIFTNSNYNNRENTDFISEMLTGIGMRKCFLIYRAYPGFQEEEVQAHAMTVARNIYGSEAGRYILGIYRTDEDNAVAAGQKFMELRPVRKKDPLFIDALTAIDSRRLRPELLSSILNGVLIRAGEVLGHARTSCDELRLYLDILQTVQSRYVHEALQHFPMDRVMKRFVETWMATDPPYVKAMRRAGSIIETPFRVLVGAAKWVTRRSSANEKIDTETYFIERVEEDLLKAVNNLRDSSVSSDISVSTPLQDPQTRQRAEVVARIRTSRELQDNQNPRTAAAEEQGTLTFFVSAHPSVYKAQEKLRRRDWKSTLQSILSRRDTLFELSLGIENALKDLAVQFRTEMGMWTKIQQVFSAFLNVVPATVAVTYIISTGDPIGAAGIKVKLTGLFGLHDLYALIAIPATTGIKKADQKQLEEILGPIVRTWLNDKLKAIQDLFESEITGGIIRIAEETLKASTQVIAQVEDDIKTCKNGRIL